MEHPNRCRQGKIPWFINLRERIKTMTQTTDKRKTALLSLTLGALVATSLSAGTVVAAQGEGETSAPPKGFFAKRFSKAKEMATKAKETVKKEAAEVAKNPGFAMCKNLFSKATFGPALKSCMINYTEEMVSLLKDLKKQKEESIPERRQAKKELHDSLKKYKSKEFTLLELFLAAEQLNDKEGKQTIREQHEMQDPAAKALHKKYDSLDSKIKKLEKQVKAIEETATNIVSSLFKKVEDGIKLSKAEENAWAHLMSFFTEDDED